MRQPVKDTRNGIVSWSPINPSCVGVLVYESFYQSYFKDSRAGLHDMGGATVGAAGGEKDVYWKVPGELV